MQKPFFSIIIPAYNLENYIAAALQSVLVQTFQDEIDQLNTEIDRVAETTKFNEIYLLKGDDGEKTINLKAHDAGLKGTLTDNGDGTATFTMKTLNAGDTVSIGGKNYTIGGEEADVKQMFTDAKITGKAGDKVTINGKEFTYYDKAAKELGISLATLYNKIKE